MYRLDLGVVFLVAFGLGPWRTLRTDFGALLWTAVVLMGGPTLLANGGIGTPARL